MFVFLLPELLDHRLFRRPVGFLELVQSRLFVVGEVSVILGPRLGVTMVPAAGTKMKLIL